MKPWVLAHGLKALLECLKTALDTDPLVVVPAGPEVPAVPAETAEPRERMLEERREGMRTGAGVLREKAQALIGPNIIIGRSFDSVEAGIATDFVRATGVQGRKIAPEKRIYATLAVSAEALINTEELLRFLNQLIVLESPPDGFYVLVAAGNAEARGRPPQRVFYVLRGYVPARLALIVNETKFLRVRLLTFRTSQGPFLCRLQFLQRLSSEARRLVSAIHCRNGMTGIVIRCSCARSFHGLELLVD